MSWPREFTDLQEAARLGQLDRARELLDGGVDQNYHPGLPKGWSPLMYAAHHGHEQVARLLLERGAIVGFACGDFSTAMTLAADAGHWEIVRLLAERGGDVSHIDSSGISALKAAEIAGNATLVEFLREMASGRASGGGAS